MFIMCACLICNKTGRPYCTNRQLIHFHFSWKKEDEREVRRKNGVKERKKKGREGLMDPDNPQTALSVVCLYRV